MTDTMIFDDSELAAIARKLHRDGIAAMADRDGNSIVIAKSQSVGLPPGELILIYQNRGVLFFDGDRPLNQFRLTSAGFSFRYAADIADMINDLIMKLGVVGNEAAPPALHGVSPITEDTTND